MEYLTVAVPVFGTGWLLYSRVMIWFWQHRKDDTLSFARLRVKRAERYLNDLIEDFERMKPSLPSQQIIARQTELDQMRSDLVDMRASLSDNDIITA